MAVNHRHEPRFRAHRTSDLFNRTSLRLSLDTEVKYRVCKQVSWGTFPKRSTFYFFGISWTWLFVDIRDMCQSRVATNKSARYFCTLAWYSICENFHCVAIFLRYKRVTGSSPLTHTKSPSSSVLPPRRWNPLTELFVSRKIQMHHMFVLI